LVFRERLNAQDAAAIRQPGINLLNGISWTLFYIEYQKEGQMKLTDFFKKGDVILTDRVFYQHYGIYAGNGRVIHYAAKNGDFGGDIRVRETNLEKFAKEGKCKPAFGGANFIGAKRFSREEVVSRARSRVGEENYNLVFNNCEHFALWCKYGTSKSVQVEKALTAAIVLGTVAIAAHLAASGEEG
jgi:cell wall-associated NlpC family hydrolase